MQEEKQERTKADARAMYQSRVNHGIAIATRDMAMQEAAQATIEEWRLHIESFPEHKIQEQTRKANAWSQVAARAAATADGRHDVFLGNPDDPADRPPALEPHACSQEVDRGL